MSDMLTDFEIINIQLMCETDPQGAAAFIK
jgi:hypothetical protein